MMSRIEALGSRNPRSLDGRDCEKRRKDSGVT